MCGPATHLSSLHLSLVLTSFLLLPLLSLSYNGSVLRSASLALDFLALLARYAPWSCSLFL